MTGSGKWPIGDQIEFGLGRAVAVRSDVVADILNPVGEEFTFLQLESDTVLHKDRTYTLEIRQNPKTPKPHNENIGWNRRYNLEKIVISTVCFTRFYHLMMSII